MNDAAQYIIDAIEENAINFLEFEYIVQPIIS